MSRVDVSNVVVADFCSRTVTVRRTTGNYNQYGEWESSTPSDFSATGSWQKVTEKELVQIGLGEIKQEVRKFLTTTEIKVSEDDDKLSDRIIVGTSRYKALKISDNEDYGFHRAFASFEGTETP